MLVHDGRLVIIDLPQIVDVVANPQGAEFLDPGRAQRGDLVRRHGVAEADGDELAALLAAEPVCAEAAFERTPRRS